MDRLQKLQSKSSAYRCQGIIACIEEKNVTSEEIEILKGMISDNNVIVGRRLSSFAKAALDLLGVQSNDGDLDAADLIKAYS